MMDLGGRTRIDIEAYAEVRKRALDQLVITIDHLLGRDTLLTGADGYRHAVLVRTANEKHLFAFEAQIAGVNVRRNIHSCQVTDMDRTVRIGECCCD